MALQELDNSNIAVHLGSISKYKSSYDPSLLVREPRQSNRTHLGLQDDDLPFVGGDTWNAYEVSGLTNTGLPVAGNPPWHGRQLPRRTPDDHCSTT